MNIRVAIVEDTLTDADHLTNLLNEFQKEHSDIDFVYSRYENPNVFLDEFQKNRFDIVFMDFDMPYLNGLETSQKLRKIDENVIIIFNTSFAQYAVQGYFVSALGYLVKPIKKEYLNSLLKTALKIINCNNITKTFAIKTKDSTIFIQDASIIYIEVNAHKIIYHTTQGDYLSNGSMKSLLKEVPETFQLCNQSYLVNLRHVKKIKGSDIWVGEDCLSISHLKRKEFMEALTKYIGNTL